jgi:hypothetical protein
MVGGELPLMSRIAKNVACNKFIQEPDTFFSAICLERRIGEMRRQVNVTILVFCRRQIRDR